MALFLAKAKSSLFKREGLQFLSIIDRRECGGENEYAFGGDEEGN